MSDVYTVPQWLFFFYFYCFFGWCFESTYVSICEKRLVNRGFMRGPFLPLYGSGAILFLFVTIPCNGNIIAMFFAGSISATILEYLTGVSMEAIFKVRYWDYSKKKFNFQGQICLSSSIAWGVLAIFLNKVLHRPVEVVAFMIPSRVLGGITLILSVLIAMDFALSFKAAIDLRNMLVGLEKVKREMIILRKRLDVLIAVGGDELGQKLAALDEMKENYALKIDELQDSIEAKFAAAKDAVTSKPGEYLDSAKDEVFQLLAKYYAFREKRADYTERMNTFGIHMIKNNPGMISEKFMDTFDDIKGYVRNITRKPK